MATKSSTKKVRAREAVVITVGARAPTWRTHIVRDRHTQQLVEVPLTEYPPLDPGDEGHAYVYRRDEEEYADHEAVLACPGAFVPVEE
jgi:hypothetical protein